MTLDWNDISERDFDMDLDFFKGHCTFIKSVFNSEQKILSEKYSDTLSNVREKQKERFYEYFETEQYYIEYITILKEVWILKKLQVNTNMGY